MPARVALSPPSTNMAAHWHAASVPPAVTASPTPPTWQQLRVPPAPATPSPPLPGRYGLFVPNDGGAPPLPGSDVSSATGPRVTAFRHVHHWHTIPGPESLIGWNDPSKTGDHYAISRYTTAFSLQFVHLAKVIGLFPAHIALGIVAGMLFGIGVRQGIHSMMLTNRALRALGKETVTIREHIKAGRADTPVYLRALARRNNHLKWYMRYGIALDFAATAGSAALGIGTLFRYPLLGEVSTPLFHAALPILTWAFFPLVVPSAIAVVERTSRCALTLHKTRAIRRHIKTVTDARAGAVQKLYRKRQHELRKYFAADALARTGFVAGATVSVFVGPGGLLLLVPSILAVIASECFARRIVNVDDTFPLQERLQMRTDSDYFTAIDKAAVDAKSVQALRLYRHKRYPWGWGTAFRPVIRQWRKKYGEKNGNTDKSAQVLAAFDRRETKPAKQGPTPDPVRVMDIMDDARARALFAEQVLRNEKLRRALQGHGVTMEGRKWSVDADAVAMYMKEIRWNTDWSQKTVDDLYQLAEETLLTKGRVELRRRLRALLDYYGRFARASLRYRKKKKR